MDRTLSSIPVSEWLQNILAGLTVSFVAISLGAAFGVMSGRGALAGIISAGIIAFLTSLFGGTRIQCSGPTAPMTAVTATIVAMATTELEAKIPGANPDHFINMVILLTGACIFLLGVLRLGKFITIVPNVVVSGFMDGIAVLIWVGEFKKLLGLGGTKPLEGPLAANVAVATITLVMLFTLPKLIRLGGERLGSFLPATLITIGVMSVAVHFLGVPIEHVDLGGGLRSIGDLTTMFTNNWPSTFSLEMLQYAAIPVFNLTLLAYLDTLLTSLVVDQKVQEDFGTDEKTAQNKELLAQGIANAAVAFIGGIPGAQATIRSVLILKENATLRLAGVLSGLFVLVEMVLFQDLVSYIPKAVFAGLLIKVGYDVMDWTPITTWFKELTEKPAKPRVPHIDMFFIAGTTLVTVVLNLNIAVIGFTVLFYVIRWIRPGTEDVSSEVSEGFSDEG